MKYCIPVLLLLAASFAWAQSSASTPLGVYNSSAPSLSNGNYSPLQLDSAGRLIVNVGAGSSGNAAASATGSSVPADADYCGVNVSGTLRGCTGVNPSGSVYAQQMDVTSVGGTTAVTAASGVLQVGIVGNAGAKFDAAQGATAPANVLQIAGAYNSTLPTISNGDVSAPQIDAKGQLLIDYNYVAGAAVSTAASGIPKVGLTDGSGNAINSTSNALNVSVQNSTLAVTQSGTWTVQPGNTPNTTAWLTRVPTSCGGTYYEAGMQYLPSSSTSLVATATCVETVSFSNKDTSNHQVSFQDQGTGCNSGVCATFTTYLLPPGGYVDRQFNGQKFTGGVKWNADAANVVVGNVIGWQ